MNIYGCPGPVAALSTLRTSFQLRQHECLNFRAVNAWGPPPSWLCPQWQCVLCV